MNYQNTYLVFQTIQIIQFFLSESFKTFDT